MAERLCTVDGCSGVHTAHGYCKKHYAKLRLYGDPLGVAADHNAERRGYIIGEVEWFLSFGIHPDVIARLLGYREAESLREMLRRWGRPELAESFVVERVEGDWARDYMAAKSRRAS